MKGGLRPQNYLIVKINLIIEKKLDLMDKSGNDFKKHIRFAYTDQMMKNDFIKKKNSLPDSQKSTPLQIKIDSKEIHNNFNKDSRIVLNKESSRKSSIEKNYKNNSSIIFNGV